MSKEAMKLDKEDITTAKEMAKVLRRSGKDELIVVGMLLDALLKEREEALAKQEQSVSVSNPIGEFPKTILAVIKEVANRNPKNGLDRWTDYETGAYMQDDADAALLWIKNKAKQEQGEPVAWTDENVIAWCLARGIKAAESTQQPKQEQGEPVSTPPANCRQRLKADGKVYGRSNCQVCGSMAPKWKECDAALLTTPQQRKPLTDEQVDEAVDAWFKPDADGNFSNWRERMRAAIEAAHGIKENT